MTAKANPIQVTERTCQITMGIFLMFVAAAVIFIL